MEVISASAGWVQASWWPRSNSAAFKDINRFPFFLENWKRCFHLSRKLPNGGRRRKVGYARAATFHGAPGISHRPIYRAQAQGGIVVVMSRAPCNVTGTRLSPTEM